MIEFLGPIPYDKSRFHCFIHQKQENRSNAGRHWDGNKKCFLENVTSTNQIAITVLLLVHNSNGAITEKSCG